MQALKPRLEELSKSPNMGP